MRCLARIDCHTVTVPIALAQVEHGYLVRMACRPKVAAHRCLVIASGPHALVKTNTKVSQGLSVTLLCGLAKPKDGTPRIFRNTLPVTIAEAEIVLSDDMTMTGGLPVELHRTLEVLGHTPPEVVAGAKIKLRPRMLLLSRAPPPLRGLAPTLRPTSPEREAMPETELGIWVARCRQLHQT